MRRWQLRHLASGAGLCRTLGSQGFIGARGLACEQCDEANFVRTVAVTEGNRHAPRLFSLSNDLRSPWVIESPFTQALVRHSQPEMERRAASRRRLSHRLCKPHFSSPKTVESAAKTRGSFVAFPSAAVFDGDGGRHNAPSIPNPVAIKSHEVVRGERHICPFLSDGKLAHFAMQLQSSKITIQ